MLNIISGQKSFSGVRLTDRSGRLGVQTVHRDKSEVAAGDNTVSSLAVMEDTGTTSPPTILLYRYLY